MTLNIALIGTGGIVENGHAQALTELPSAQLWSVLSRDINRAKEFAKQYGAASPEPAYDLLDALLADPSLDAVIIATPDKLHRDQAVACAKAGKHVLLEKPMATDIEGAEAIVSASEQANIKLGICYHLRWHLAHKEIIKRVRAGELGNLRHIRTLWSWKAPDDSNWRASPELGRWWSLAGVGTHCLDLARWIMIPDSGEVAQLKSTINQSVWGGPHDETAVISLKFESGSTAEICSSVLFDAPSRLEIYGSDGFAICEGTFGRDGSGRAWTNNGEIKFGQQQPFVGLLDDFVRSIAEDRKPEADAVEGEKNVRLLLESIR
jgi:UDP-N-acetyl-2-amino-2-deoxyglucuronate dehydrogenase